MVRNLGCYRWLGIHLTDEGKTMSDDKSETGKPDRGRMPSPLLSNAG